MMATVEWRHSLCPLPSMAPVTLDGHLTSVQLPLHRRRVPGSAAKGAARDAKATTMVEETEISIRYEHAPPEHVARLQPVTGLWDIGCLPDRHLTSGQAYAAVSIADALASNLPWMRPLVVEWAVQLGMTAHDAYAVFGNGVRASRRWAAEMQAVAR